jgi:2-(1,2-epoxy-1,2-dihydrophenyl)acetyl-CoA isomerase
MQRETVDYVKKDDVVWLTLNRPAAMNAMNLALAMDLRDAITEVSNDTSARALVIQGAGKAFCAGGDVGWFHAGGEKTPHNLRELIVHVHAVSTLIAELNLPVIGGIHGAVAGAGVGLALSLDVTVASAKTVFTLAYTGIGASPDGGSTYHLTRMVGARKALELIYGNDVVNAEQALALGLVNEVVEPEQLPARLQALAAKLASGPTRAYANARKLVQHSSNNSLPQQLHMEAEGIIASARTADFVEGVAAFMEKRKPVFSGK